MIASHLIPSQALHLVAAITHDDDGAHAADLIKLIEGLVDSEDESGNAAKDYLRHLGEGCACDSGSSQATHNLVAQHVNRRA